MYEGTCRVGGCDRAPTVPGSRGQRGYCGRHLWRLERYGDPNATPPALEERFWSRVRTSQPNECWTWIGARDSKGYGLAAIRQPGSAVTKTTRAQRVAFYLTYGYFPPVVRHTCDNPPCVNPAHLLPGDRGANARDRDRRGRTPKGSNRPQAKVTEDAVMAIRQRRAAGDRVTDLAREFGLTCSSVSNIVARRTWRHI